MKKFALLITLLACPFFAQAKSIEVHGTDALKHAISPLKHYITAKFGIKLGDISGPANATYQPTNAQANNKIDNSRLTEVQSVVVSSSRADYLAPSCQSATLKTKVNALLKTHAKVVLTFGLTEANEYNEKDLTCTVTSAAQRHLAHR